MLKVTAEATDPRQVRADLLVVPVFKGGIEGPGTKLALAALGVDDLPITPAFRGDTGQHLLLAAPGDAARGLASRGVLLVGLGRMDQTDPASLRRAAGVAAGAAGEVRRVATTLAEIDSTSAAVEAVAEGFHLGAYRDQRFKSDPDVPRLREVVILTPSGKLSEARLAVQRAEVYARATYAARDLVNQPPDRKRPAVLASTVTEMVGHCCDTVVRAADDLASEGFGGLLAVGAGSTAPPCLVELRYRPPNPLGHVVLVGKGITFDSGGLSLKRGEAMEGMKADMAGAAAVAAVCSVLDELGIRMEVTGLLPLAENMPSGTAQRPGDVITVHGGKTVEVLDTDAEGRLVLADALDYATGLEPDVMVDLATLTGSAITALGQHAAPLMGTDDDLIASLRQAATVAGEDVWPLPLWSSLEHLLDSAVADANNTGDGAGAGAIIGGLFLRRFTGDVPWAHLDIAGPAFLPSSLAGAHLPAGGTGFGVRTLLAWLERRAA